MSVGLVALKVVQPDDGVAVRVTPSPIILILKIAPSVATVSSILVTCLVIVASGIKLSPEKDPQPDPTHQSGMPEMYVVNALIEVVTRKTSVRTVFSFSDM